jgi:hypothetical protein
MSLRLWPVSHERQRSERNRTLDQYKGRIEGHAQGESRMRFGRLWLSPHDSP